MKYDKKDTSDLISLLTELEQLGLKGRELGKFIDDLNVIKQAIAGTGQKILDIQYRVKLATELNKSSYVDFNTTL